MLKRIGTAARHEIEEMSGRKVFLELRVKVLKDWRKDENAMRRFGYKIKKKKNKIFYVITPPNCGGVASHRRWRGNLQIT